MIYFHGNLTLYRLTGSGPPAPHREKQRYHGLKWHSEDTKEPAPATPAKIISSPTASTLPLRGILIKARCNKAVIQHVRQDVCCQHQLSISKTNAHTGASTPEALGNVTADRLAAKNRSGSSSALSRPDLAARHPNRQRPMSGPSDPLQRYPRSFHCVLLPC